MLLDVYYKLCMYSKMKAGLSSASPIAVPAYYTTSGAQKTVLYDFDDIGDVYDGIASQTEKTSERWNIVVGSGTTPVTGSDTKIEQEITSGLTAAGVVYESDVNSGIVTVRKTMVNNSGSVLTISEIGIVAKVYTGGATYFPVLIYREVLDEPLLVPDGETFTVSITSQIPMTA